MLRVPAAERELAGLGQVQPGVGEVGVGKDIDADEQDRGQRQGGETYKCGGRSCAQPLFLRSTTSMFA